jgi:hypothetical protein
MNYLNERQKEIIKDTIAEMEARINIMKKDLRDDEVLTGELIEHHCNIVNNRTEEIVEIIQDIR